MRLTDNLLHHFRYSLDGVRPTAYRPPVYPLIIAAVFGLAGNILSVRIVQYVLVVALAWAVYRFMHSQGKHLAGLLGSLCILGYPLLFYTSSTLYPQSIGSVLLVGILLAFQQTRNPRAGFLAGGLGYGLLMLMIPGFLLLCPLMLPSPWLLRKAKAGLLASIFSGGVLVVVMPWCVRNLVVFGEFVPLSTSSGINLLLGNSENAGANTGVNVDLSQYQAAGMDELARDRYFRKMAIQWILEHPSEALVKYCQRVLNYFNYRNQLYTSSESGSLIDLLMLLTYAPLLLVVVVRAFASRSYRYDRFEAFIYIIYFANALLAAITFTRIRFRVPFDVMLILGVAIFLNEAFERYRHLKSEIIVGRTA